MIRLLLDENLPKKLKYRFGEDYQVTTGSGLQSNRSINYFTAVTRSSAARFNRTSILASDC